MTEFICSCGGLIAASAAMLVIRDSSKTAAALLGAALCTAVFVFAVRRLAPAAEQIRTAAAGLEDTAATLLKGLGIAYLTSFTASTLRDLDAANSARLAELIGRTELVILALPVTADLIALAVDLAG